MKYIHFFESSCEEDAVREYEEFERAGCTIDDASFQYDDMCASFKFTCDNPDDFARYMGYALTEHNVIDE